MRNRKTQKTASFLLAVALSLGLCSTVSASAAGVSDFTDVSSHNWYYESVSYGVSNGLYNGVSATKFEPNSPMTRGMFVTVLGRMAGVDAASWCAATITGSGVNFRSGPGTSYATIGSFSRGDAVIITGRSGDWYKISYGTQSGYVKASYVSPKYKNFSDVSYNRYYTGYVIWAYENGYVSGHSSSSFAPDEYITREQICKILNSYASSKGYTVRETNSAMTFTDATSIHSWAKDAVAVMQRGGIVNGYPEDGGFHPLDNASRAEVAKMIYTFISATGLTVGAAGSGTSGSSGGSTSGNSGGSENDSTNDTSDNDTTEGTTTSAAATLSSETIGVYGRLRVGLYPCSASDFSQQVPQVKLTNLDGNGFEYGKMGDDRIFVKEGTIDSAVVVITTDGTTYTVTDGNGTTLATREGTALALHPLGEHPLTQVDGLYSYYGDFNCLNSCRDASKITLVNYVAVEDYVKGVLPYEFGTSWPAETLKAAAIAVRSYAMVYTQTSAYKKYGFDLVNGSSCQVYRGRNTVSSAVDAAVDATANMYLTYNNSLCYCMYSSSNGGTTKAGNYAYLTSKTDPYDKEASVSYTGHGVGMSQWGAYIMAKNYGLNYLDILGFYYTGTTVKYGV